MRRRAAAAGPTPCDEHRTSEPTSQDNVQAEVEASGDRASKNDGGEAWLWVAVLVALIPLLVGLAFWCLLPHETFAKALSKPKTKLGMDVDGVRAQLRNHTLLHIGGLHRSGTTLLWEALARHPAVGKLEFQPGADRRHASWINKVYNEGIFLQSVYPKFGLDHRRFVLKKWASQLARKIPFMPESFLAWTHLREGVGRFALNPDHHLSEVSPLVHEGSQVQLLNQWGIFWDVRRPVLMEKSPSNLVIAPFLHRLWGLGLDRSPARFLFVQRHPIAVALATLRAGGETADDLSVADLVENWLAAEERRAEDERRYFGAQQAPEDEVAAGAQRGLGSARALTLTVTLEEVCREPARILREILDWLGLQPEESALRALESSVQRDPNEKYFRAYCKGLAAKTSMAIQEHADLVSRFADRVRAVAPYDLRAVEELCQSLA